MHTKRLRKATGIIRSICNNTIIHNMLSIVTNQLYVYITSQRVHAPRFLIRKPRSSVYASTFPYKANIDPVHMQNYPLPLACSSPC